MNYEDMWNELKKQIENAISYSIEIQKSKIECESEKDVILKILEESNKNVATKILESVKEIMEGFEEGFSE